MMSGCASTMTVCPTENKLQTPEQWAMVEPESAIKQQDIDKSKILLQATENNGKWAKDKAKVIYLQKYINEILKDQK